MIEETVWKERKSSAVEPTGVLSMDYDKCNY